ncbi:hypothetical protein BJX61DRAFT_499965 [Aspergillus egyptiacus]|nr:hypothetical protein BJX61DRAFT_499965 [Aspergillus egyptiacus]
MSAPDTSLDDIFGSSPPDHHQPQPPATAEPSELPSLRRQHVTAGYRDGISASKAQHVQRGFDAGFPVGAQLGMRAGTILGIIEGMLKGYESAPGSAVGRKPNQKSVAATVDASGKEAEELRNVQREQVLKLYRQAVKELSVQAVFAGMDGLEHSGEEGEEEKQKPEEQLLRKGDAVLAEWEERVRVAAWEENTMDVLEAKSDAGAQADMDPKNKGSPVIGTAEQS